MSLSLNLQSLSISRAYKRGEHIRKIIVTDPFVNPELTESPLPIFQEKRDFWGC